MRESWKQKKVAILGIGIHQRGLNMIGVPNLNLKDSLQGFPNSTFSSFFPRLILHFTILSHVK